MNSDDLYVFKCVTEFSFTNFMLNGIRLPTKRYVMTVPIEETSDFIYEAMQKTARVANIPRERECIEYKRTFDADQKTITVEFYA